MWGPHSYLLPPTQATRNTGKSIANRNIANPTAALLAACMMLDHLRWAGPSRGGRGLGREERGKPQGGASTKGWGLEHGVGLPLEGECPIGGAG